MLIFFSLGVHFINWAAGPGPPLLTMFQNANRARKRGASLLDPSAGIEAPDAAGAASVGSSSALGTGGPVSAGWAPMNQTHGASFSHNTPKSSTTALITCIEDKLDELRASRDELEERLAKIAAESKKALEKMVDDKPYRLLCALKFARIGTPELDFWGKYQHSPVPYPHGEEAIRVRLVLEINAQGVPYRVKWERVPFVDLVGSSQDANDEA